MPPMANTTFVSVVDLSLAEEAKSDERNHSLYRQSLPLLFSCNRDRSFDRQPEHMYRFSASVAFHPDDSWECGAYPNYHPPGLHDTKMLSP